MARFAVVIPVLAVVDTGAATSISNDSAIAVANAWLALPALSGMVVQAKVLEGGRSYGVDQLTNAQLVASSGQNDNQSAIKFPLA